MNTKATVSYCDIVEIICRPLLNKSNAQLYMYMQYVFLLGHLISEKVIYFFFLFAVAKINMSHVKLIFWDLGGQQELQSLWDKVLSVHVHDCTMYSFVAKRALQNLFCLPVVLSWLSF